MTKLDLLEKIKADRPEQIIYDVLDFKKTKHNLYLVKVDMETNILGTVVKHSRVIIPYPLLTFNALPEKQKSEVINYCLTNSRFNSYVE